MKVVITGGGGFLGKKLARRILQQGSIAGEDGKPRRVGELLLFDVARASGPGLDDPRVKASRGRHRQRLDGARHRPGRHDRVPLCRSGERRRRRADFDLEAISVKTSTAHAQRARKPAARSAPTPGSSSLPRSRPYGGDLPPAVTDDTPLTPQTSYGSQKLRSASFLLRDATRARALNPRHGPSACRRSACAPACPTRRPRPGQARWCASRA